MPPTTLSRVQAHALFDILTHSETRTEIESFKFPEAICHYGPPFTDVPEDGPSAPLLRLLVTKFALTLPGLRSVAPEFWQERCQRLLKELGDAELSESYDKGTVGLRRTLSCASAVVLEYPIRGCLGGYSSAAPSSERSYDPGNTEDVLAAWNDFTHQLVHGHMVDQLFAKAKETDKLEDHPSIVRAAHEYIVINLASLLYHILILSPDGPYLVKVIDDLNKLVPYAIIRQTLRVGNAATMISGMVKLVLTKFSVGSLTNWMGFSQDAAEGMNLLQQIVSTVLTWDISEMKRKTSKIEKSKDVPSKEHLDCIKEYIKKSRDEHQMTRSRSEGHSKSIVAIIFEDHQLSTELSDAQHTTTLEYLALNLSIRDREQLINILCKRQPDLLTQAIRDVVAAYDPVIRAIHNAVDLSGTLADFQSFLHDLLKLAKTGPQGGRGGDETLNSGSGMKAPSMGDFVSLLKRHQSSSHKFLHQVAHNGPEVTEWFREYLKSALSEFRRASLTEDGESPGAGELTPALDNLVGQLSVPDRSTVLRELDEYAIYLDRLHNLSSEKMRLIVSGNGRTSQGPGIFLSRWKDLMDATVLTPSTVEGRVRFGYSTGPPPSHHDGKSKCGDIQPPKVHTIVRLLRKPFKDFLVEHLREP